MPEERHFLSDEAAIVARLEALMSSEVKVLTAPDLEGVVASRQQAPAVQVVYRGYNVEDDNPGFVKVTHTWFTVVCVRNVRNVRQGGATRHEAGELLSQVVGALQRWRPEGGKPLRMVNAVPPGYLDGFGYFPIGWETTHTIRSECE